MRLGFCLLPYAPLGCRRLKSLVWRDQHFCSLVCMFCFCLQGSLRAELYRLAALNVQLRNPLTAKDMLGFFLVSVAEQGRLHNNTSIRCSAIQNNCRGCWITRSKNSVSRRGLQLQRGIWIEEAELSTTIQMLPARIAVPTGSAPSAVWKLCHESVARHIALLQRKLSAKRPGIVPQLWRDTDLAWLLKPGKDPGLPESMRPIGLMHLLSKSVTLILSDRLRPTAPYSGPCSTVQTTVRIHARKVHL